MDKALFNAGAKWVVQEKLVNMRDQMFYVIQGAIIVTEKVEFSSPCLVPSFILFGVQTKMRYFYTPLRWGVPWPTITNY
jgi:hypothetical protein